MLSNRIHLLKKKKKTNAFKAYVGLQLQSYLYDPIRIQLKFDFKHTSNTTKKQ